MCLFPRTTHGCRRVRHNRDGFSLIELLVSIAIIAIISAVVLARYKSFNSTILLRDLAYEIALSIREAQVYGVSVHSAGGSFNFAYGIHFTRGTTYVLFADSSPINGRYDAGEELSSYAIGQQNAIVDLCRNATCGRTSLDVLFRRPEPDARFAVNGSVVTPSSVRVVVRGGTGGNTRTVRVSTTGQISIE